MARTSDTDDTPVPESTTNEIAEFGRTLDDRYGNWADIEKSLAFVSYPRFGSERLFLVSKAGRDGPPATLVDFVENNGFPFLSERTINDNRWIAVLEPLSHKKERQNAENPDVPLVRERGDHGKRLAQLAQQATQAIIGYKEACQKIEYNGEQAYEDPGDARSAACDGLEFCQMAMSSFLGWEPGIIQDMSDVPEIVAEHLLACPKEAAYGRETVRKMGETAEVIGADATLTRTEAVDGNEDLAEMINECAVRAVGNAKIAHTAIDQFVVDQSYLDR